MDLEGKYMKVFNKVQKDKKIQKRKKIEEEQRKQEEKERKRLEEQIKSERRKEEFKKNKTFIENIFSFLKKKTYSITEKKIPIEALEKFVKDYNFFILYEIVNWRQQSEPVVIFISEKSIKINGKDYDIKEENFINDLFYELLK